VPVIILLPMKGHNSDFREQLRPEDADAVY